MGDIDKYHGHLFLDLDYLIEDISRDKERFMRLIKGYEDCYPLYIDDIKNIINSIEESKAVEVKKNVKYECLRTKDRNMIYYNYLIILSTRLLNIYNKYKTVEDELKPEHSYMGAIQDILNRINKWKKEWQNNFNSYEKKVKNSQNKARNLASGNSPNFTARLRNPLNTLSKASPYKKWFRKSRKNRSTRKRK